MAGKRMWWPSRPRASALGVLSALRKSETLSSRATPNITSPSTLLSSVRVCGLKLSCTWSMGAMMLSPVLVWQGAKPRCPCCAGTLGETWAAVPLHAGHSDGNSGQGAHGEHAREFQRHRPLHAGPGRGPPPPGRHRPPRARGATRTSIQGREPGENTRESFGVPARFPRALVEAIPRQGGTVPDE